MDHDVTVCLNCRFFSGDDHNIEFCGCPQAPYTDFVHGHKDPRKLNRGACPYYARKRSYRVSWREIDTKK